MKILRKTKKKKKGGVLEVRDYEGGERGILYRIFKLAIRNNFQISVTIYYGSQVYLHINNLYLCRLLMYIYKYTLYGPEKKALSNSTRATAREYRFDININFV